jgi:hypothetical protein
MNPKTKKILFAITGLLLFPVLIAAIMLDRLLLVILLHLEVKTLGAHIKDLRLFIPVFYRLLTLSVLTLLFTLIASKF